MFELGTRKIKEVAGSFLVALPMVWVENQGLGKGDEVLCVLHDSGDLLIKAQRKEGG